MEKLLKFSTHCALIDASVFILFPSFLEAFKVETSSGNATLQSQRCDKCLIVR